MGVFPLFHWSFIPWAFYFVLAVAFGFMHHVRKRNCLRYSEACRSVIGIRVDGILGRVIVLFALFALLAGTATAFSVATPLRAGIIVKLFNIEISRTMVTIIIFLIGGQGRFTIENRFQSLGKMFQNYQYNAMCHLHFGADACVYDCFLCYVV